VSEQIADAKLVPRWHSSGVRLKGFYVSRPFVVHVIINGPAVFFEVVSAIFAARHRATTGIAFVLWVVAVAVPPQSAALIVRAFLCSECDFHVCKWDYGSWPMLGVFH
jgi:hypothetical protein